MESEKKRSKETGYDWELTYPGEALRRQKSIQEIWATCNELYLCGR